MGTDQHLLIFGLDNGKGNVGLVKQDIVRPLGFTTGNNLAPHLYAARSPRFYPYLTVTK